MEFLAEALVVLLEVFLEVFWQLLVEIGLRRATIPFRSRAPLHPVLSALGYILLGGTLGFISVHLWPTPLAHSLWLRLLMLGLMPTLAGLAMMAVGAWRQRRDQALIRFDRFASAFLFAFVFALIRFIWAA